MYGYGEYTPLIPEEIFKRVSEEEIFQMVFTEDIVLDKGVLYRAPYRADELANCWFEKYNGILYFVDFADSSTKSKNCFEFIKRVYNVDYKEALEIISDEFELGLGDNLKKAKKVINENDYFLEEKKIKKAFKERIITLVPRTYIYKDKQFWQQYKISRDNLIEDKTLAIELYRSTSKEGKMFTIRPLDICYAYTNFTDLEGNLLKDKVKIYRPYASSEAKWFTNCNQNIIGSLSHLPKKGKLLIITKSYKDCRVLRNLGFNAIWFQNEGMLPSAEIIKVLTRRFKKIIVWFDNDRTGMANSKVVTDYINSIKKGISTSIMLPPRLLHEGMKDPSDLMAIWGEDSLISFLQHKNLLKNNNKILKN